jgi:hypothetical protein
VAVLDNAPAHRRNEARVTPHDDLDILRLTPYSLMCNTMEGYFSVLKTQNEEALALDCEAQQHDGQRQPTPYRE